MERSWMSADDHTILVGMRLWPGAQIKKKMTREEFIRNNRGINGSKDAPADLPKEFLTELYTHFSERAIRFPQMPSSMSGKYSSPTSDATIDKCASCRILLHACRSCKERA